MKAYQGKETHSTTFLGLSTTRSPSLPGCFTPFIPGREPRNPLNRRLGRPHSRSGHSGGEKYFLLLQGLEPQIFQSLASSNVLTTLCRLLSNLSGRNIFTKFLSKIKSKFCTFSIYSPPSLANYKLCVNFLIIITKNTALG